MNISVIVPVYNVAGYVDKCIKSILDQTYRDFEVLLIDDGSRDGSDAICRKWAEKDDRIVLICKENKGVSAARNDGIQKSKGDYLVFVDGDDYLEENFLEEMVACHEKHPECDMYLCGYYYDEGRSREGYSFFSKDRMFGPADRDFLICRAIGVSENEIKRKTNIGVPWAKMYRKSFLTDNDLHFDEDMPKMQDLVFNVRCYKRVTAAIYMDKPLYNYVYRPESTVNKYNPGYDKLAKLILDRLQEELGDDSSEVVKEALRYEAILLLIENIRLKYTKKECGLSLGEKRREIKKIASAEPYHSAIKLPYKHISNSKAQDMFRAAMRADLYLLGYFFVVLKYRGK